RAAHSACSLSPQGPRRGEGWGEGVTINREHSPPSPPPSPRWGEGVPPCHDESPCSPNFSYAAWRLFPVFCNADHTVCAVPGMVKFSEPIALVMALITAGGAAGAPAPPPPLMPSGFSRPFGVAVWEVCPRRVSARR